MRSFRLFVVLCVALAIPPAARAQLRFAQPGAELGELRGGPVYTHRFDFVNESPGPIEIIDVRLGCGCLQPTLEKRTYAAGERGSLRFNIRTLGQPSGMRTWEAYVQYRQGGQVRETRLALAATIRNEITIEPSILAMTVETSLQQELTIADHRPTPGKVKAVLASSRAIHVAVQPTAAGVTRVVLEVKAADLPAGRTEEMLAIYLDDPFYRQLEVPITLVKAVRPAVTAAPERVEVACPGAQLVRLRADGARPVRIEKIDVNNAGIKCTWAAGPGNDATLKISADATARFLAPSTPPRVLVHLAEPAGAMVEIPVALRQD